MLYYIKTAKPNQTNELNFVKLKGTSSCEGLMPGWVNLGHGKPKQKIHTQKLWNQNACYKKRKGDNSGML